MGNRHRIGRRGETAAATWLANRGWRILDRNWRAGHAELDLVARRGDLVAFVEVKTRSRDRRGDPLESITYRKRREVQRAAADWLRRRACTLQGVRYFRFDAMAVRITPGRRVRIRHVEDAWRIDDRRIP